MALMLARSSTVDWLFLAGRGLLLALPVLLVVGRSPADIAVSLIALLFLGHSVVMRDWGWVRTPWVALGLGVWAYLIGVSLLAPEPEAALSRALPFGRFVLFAAALQHWLLGERGTQRALLAVLAAVVAFVALDTLLQFATGTDLLGRGYEAKRLTGPFTEPVPGTFLAHTAFPLLGLALGWAAAARALSRLMLAIGLAVALAIIVALSGERMALLTFGLGLAVLALLLPGLRLVLIGAGLVAVLMVASAAIVYPSVATRLINHTVHDVEDFWNRRYGEMFARAAETWTREPVLGIGLKHFRTACENEHFEPLGPVEDRCYTHPHQIYLEWLVETGAVGFAGFLALVVLWGRALVGGLRRSGPDYALIAGACTAVFLFLWPLRSSMSFFSNWHAILFWLMLGLALALCAPRTPEGRLRTPS